MKVKKKYEKVLTGQFGIDLAEGELPVFSLVLEVRQCLAGCSKPLFGLEHLPFALPKLAVLTLLFLGLDPLDLRGMAPPHSLEFLLQPSDLGLLLFKLGCVFLVLLLQLELEGLLLG